MDMIIYVSFNNIKLIIEILPAMRAMKGWLTSHMTNNPHIILLLLVHI